MTAFVEKTVSFSTTDSSLAGLRLAAGHHATERFGVQSLTRWLREQGLDAHYVEIDNPI